MGGNLRVAPLAVSSGSAAFRWLRLPIPYPLVHFPCPQNRSLNGRWGLFWAHCTTSELLNFPSSSAGPIRWSTIVGELASRRLDSTVLNASTSCQATSLSPYTPWLWAPLAGNTASPLTRRAYARHSTRILLHAVCKPPCDEPSPSHPEDVAKAWSPNLSSSSPSSNDVIKTRV